MVLSDLSHELSRTWSVKHPLEHEDYLTSLTHYLCVASIQHAEVWDVYFVDSVAADLEQEMITKSRIARQVSSVSSVSHA